ncbi:MAG: Maf family protein [Clostridiales bacterium]|nr:Maf family protein [Clostridiales bacterium]
MLILASKSPRRKELLSLITNDFVIKSSNEDETRPENITPQKAVEYLSKIKAAPFSSDDDTVIGADTVVCAEGIILGKPKDDLDAFEMLKFLGGREHSVFTGVTIIGKGKSVTFSEETKVVFYPLSDAEIEEYVKTGESADKAGAYGIQGKGALLVKEIHGDYFNVVGLPVGRLAKELARFL